MIYTIGETVIDLIFKNMQPQSAKVGGSALNTSVSLGRLGNNVSFISEIGNDELGKWCIAFLQENHIYTSNLISYKDKKTSLALAFLNEKNDAKYQFYKEFSEEMVVPSSVFNRDDILLFSSSFAINERVRKCVKSLLENAKQNDMLIMYDPNMRKQLDKSSQAYCFMQENLDFADVTHISDEDAQAIFGTTDVDTIFTELQKHQVQALVYTQNSNVVIVKTATFTKSYPVPQISVVSTIGAGDTFNAGILHYLQKEKIHKNEVTNLSNSFFDDAIPFAIQCAGEVCQSMDNYISLKTTLTSK